MKLTVYEVTLDCKRHYGNGYFEYHPESQNIIAKNGEQAVEIAKKRVQHADPVLRELKILLNGVKSK